MTIQDKNGGVEAFRPTRDELNEWLKGQILCVLSTLDESGAPMGVTVAFSVTKGGELLIGTSETSRKSQNIDRDDRVAVTVTDSEERMTAQIQGIANKLPQDIFEHDYADEHYSQRPESLPFKDEPGQCHILIAPKHIRFSDVSVFPWVVTEFNN